MARPIRHLRWYIGGLLFLSTVINYIDRQTLSVLAPFLKTQYNWTNTDYAIVALGFRAAYTIGQTVVGRVIDRVGTRRGLSLSVLWYSTAAMLTSLAGGLWSFATFRFMLGWGEAGNWPGATKAVSEWFPRRESGWAVALFDSGSSVGGAIAPFIALWAYHYFDDWRPAFLVTGALGFVWLAVFRRLYHPPESHPRITPEEREYIVSGRDAGTTVDQCLPYGVLLRLKQTWGYILGKAFTDPVWFFVTDWLALVLVAKGFKIEESLLGFWVPFLAADLGNLFGGGLSSMLIARGMSVGWARKTIAIIGGLGMMLILPVAWSSSFPLIVTCLAISTFAYAAFSTIVLNLPADLFPPASVASVSGMGGTGAGLGTMTSLLTIGYVADHYSFEPILVGASIVPLVAMAAVLFLVRNDAATEAGIVKRI
jgi:ACS family hexuronate transporter-like MFS transporter